MHIAPPRACKGKQEVLLNQICSIPHGESGDRSSLTASASRESVHRPRRREILRSSAISALRFLEARIAPATFLIQPRGYDIFKDDGPLSGTAANEMDAKEYSVADAAVFLATGDRLAMDGNKKADKGEPVASIAPQYRPHR